MFRRGNNYFKLQSMNTQSSDSSYLSYHCWLFTTCLSGWRTWAALDTFSQWNDKEYYHSMVSISTSVGESKGKLFYFTLKDNYLRNVHTRRGLVICTAWRCGTVLCLRTAAGGAVRHVPLWASTGICPSLSRTSGCIWCDRKPFEGETETPCPRTPAKRADSLSAPPCFLLLWSSPYHDY